MPAELYNQLTDSNVTHTGTDALVAAFALEGRLHRAALELADAEMLEGTWVREEAEVEQVMRYAADDRAELQADYSSEGYTVRVSMDEDGWAATQTTGLSGASLKVEGDWHALTPGQPTILPIQALPESLLLVDLNGHELQLTR
jgi:hypothetical protein